MKYLKILNLSYNLFHTLNQGIFKHTRDLKILSLRGNPLTVIDTPTLNALSSIPILEELDLSYCGLKDLPHYIFHTSHKLVFSNFILIYLLITYLYMNIKKFDLFYFNIGN